jgi:hypothetical protein
MFMFCLRGPWPNKNTHILNFVDSDFVSQKSLSAFPVDSTAAIPPTVAVSPEAITIAAFFARNIPSHILTFKV